MVMRKTTICLDESLIKDLDTIASALKHTRNKVITDSLQKYVKEHKTKAVAIANKREELEQLKKGF